MVLPRSLTVYASPSAGARLEAARAALGRLRHHRTITIVGASRGAADDFARHLVASSPSTFGINRFSLTQFAARTAIVSLARQGTTPSTTLVTEAIATRAAFDAARSKTLEYFAPVAFAPGFPRALARTLGELRGAGLAIEDVRPVPLVGADLAHLLDHFARAIGDARASDRTALFKVCAQSLADHRPGGSFVLLDLPLRDHAERQVAEAVIANSDLTVATVAPGDDAEDLYMALGAEIVRTDEEAKHDLSRLRKYLFQADEQPTERDLDGTLELFSAPGEGRECVEIARRVLRESARGVRFDEMAVLVRSPHSYFGLLEHAMTRAGIPTWFDRGTRRPHPAGRAFLALLACAADRISAVRFAEYLSLAQVPTEGGETGDWETPRDEVTWRADEREDDELESEGVVAQQEPASHESAVVAGTLRAPWRWESLIVDAKIIGGGAARWRRRFEGHRRELERRLIDAGKEEGAAGGESPEGLRIEGTLRQLGHLEKFAIPIVETLETWVGEASWGEWLDRFDALAPRVLRRPPYVLRVLAELRPMAGVGPIGLDEARRVLATRLLTVEAEAPSRRYGRLFVGTPDQARGRSFRVVFVPGLAERLFPQKPREDPLLLDTFRAPLSDALTTEPRRILAERQLLRLSVGAAAERLCVSYPRIELSEARARVPSFYVLDLLRAATGRIPAHETLEEQARRAGGASLAWPAPVDPVLAIDDVEHDLAVVRRLLDHPAKDEVRGHAHYLLTISEPLRRSVIERWRRAGQEWSPLDGVTRVTPSTAPALAAQRLTERSYSPSALQKFAACPYQFVLSAFFRLQPLEEPVPLERIDPLTRGSLIHDVQARLMRELRDRGALPITPTALSSITRRLDEVIDEVAERAREELAPAVERVWRDDVASMRRDMHGWLERMAADNDWIPSYFEFGFGRIPGERDPASAPDAVRLESGYSLRGAIDLIEVHKSTGELRVTDYKTGRPPEKLDGLRIAGGTILQPIMYGLAAELALARRVSHGRLFFCTTSAGYRSHPIQLDEDARRVGIEVLEIIDRAIANGGLMAAPAERACDRCDYGAVCGPEVPRRIAQKKRPLADLIELRSRR